MDNKSVWCQIFKDVLQSLMTDIQSINHISWPTQQTICTTTTIKSTRSSQMADVHVFCNMTPQMLIVTDVSVRMPVTIYRVQEYVTIYTPSYNSEDLNLHTPPRALYILVCILQSVYFVRRTKLSCVTTSVLPSNCAGWSKNHTTQCNPYVTQKFYFKKVFPGGKGGRCVRLTTLPPSCAAVMKSGNLNFL